MKAKKYLGLKTFKFARAKKALGQNFLKSAIALRKIIETGEIKPGDVILEIGPGRGVLTEKLLVHSRFVIAVEKDREFFEFLKNKFAEQIKLGSLVLVNGDILDFNASAYSSFEPGGSQSLNGLKPSAYKIIANIPYNITGAILKKFLTAVPQPSLMVLMVQNEVARRIIARDSKESILSISVKAYGEPKMIIKVPARYFSPAPKVDSAIIAIKNISRKIFEENKIDEEIFWKIVKMGFSHKRKKLSSNLKSLKRDLLVSSLHLGNKRAENLSITDWISLAKT